MTTSLPPAVKWSGSKRAVAGALHALWGEGDATGRYLEPFLGSGAMLVGRPVPDALAGDVVVELVALFQAIRDRPAEVAAHYRHHWLRRQREGGEVFTEVRARFNATRDPCDLLFLSRTCVNGLIRFNRHGDFNNSLHHTRPGIHPDRLAPLLDAWSGVLAHVELVAGDYRALLARAAPGDRVFLDPPYAGNVGRYAPEPFDFEPLWEALRRLDRIGARWMLTLDGTAGGRSYAHGVPADLARHRLDLPTGHSPFTRLMRTSLDPVVESVFLSHPVVWTARTLSRAGSPPAPATTG